MKILTVRCGRCAKEKRHPERLGTVHKDMATGRIVWVPEDPRFGRLMRRLGHKDTDNVRGGKTLSFGELDHKFRFRVPVELHAYCKRHGIGTIKTADVIEKRGKLIVSFTAAASRGKPA